MNKLISVVSVCLCVLSNIVVVIFSLPPVEYTSHFESGKKNNYVKMFSEEILKLNKALKHCDSLKKNLHESVLHLQNLNEKYNKIDYLEQINLFEAARKSIMSNFSPSIKHNRHSNKLKSSPLSLFASSSPLSTTFKSITTKSLPASPLSTTCQSIGKRSMNKNRLSVIELATASTPAAAAKKTATTPIKRIHMRRSAYEIKQNNNTIMVRTLKVHRNIETILTSLTVLQRKQHKNYVTMLEQSLYQECNNSSFDSPGKLGHFHCFNATIGNNISDNCHNSSDGSSCGVAGRDDTRNSSFRLNHSYQVKRKTNDNMCATSTPLNKQLRTLNFTPIANYRKRLNLSVNILRTC